MIQDQEPISTFDIILILIQFTLYLRFKLSFANIFKISDFSFSFFCVDLSPSSSPFASECQMVSNFYVILVEKKN